MKTIVHLKKSVTLAKISKLVVGPKINQSTLKLN